MDLRFTVWQILMTVLCMASSNLRICYSFSWETNDHFPTVLCTVYGAICIFLDSWRLVRNVGNTMQAGLLPRKFLGIHFYGWVNIGAKINYNLHYARGYFYNYPFLYVNTHSKPTCLFQRLLSRGPQCEKMHSKVFPFLEDQPTRCHW